MPTASAGDILATRLAQLKQKQLETQGQKQSHQQPQTAQDQCQSQTTGLAQIAAIIQPNTPNSQPLLIKPIASTWEVLEQKLIQVVNLPGFMDTRIKQLYDDGYGAELETAAEIALSTAKKSPYNMFAAMVSTKAGNWATKTLEVVHTAWEARRNALAVIDKLNLSTDSLKQILALSWRLKGTIIRYLGIATEQGTNVKNPIGLFFWLTKKQATSTA